MSAKYFVGIDVGTGSARAALVDIKGKLLKQHIVPIETWNPKTNYYEQSSNNIWQAVCICVRTVAADVPKDQVVGIGFDATCSLVVLGDGGVPLAVNPEENIPERNIILWMDHRADKEAEFINKTKHELLKYVGGQVSVEMEIPKLLWLKRNHAETWSKIWRAFDLSDFLTWRCTDSECRSLCSVVCKWNYDAINMSWDKKFLQEITLNELSENNFSTIGSEICFPGATIANGLSKRGAEEFNLMPGTAVGTALIDAHAGALGMFGCRAENFNSNIETKMAIISGTSTCHMSLSREPCWANGVWGPYRNAIIPDYFLNEAGQSTTGFLIDYIIKNHRGYDEILNKIKSKDSNVPAYLNDLLKELAAAYQMDDICYLTKDFHMYPDFHGNRSPMADPTLKGMLSGLNMNNDEKSLAILYLSCVQALAYQTRHIIEMLLNSGRSNKFDMLLFCGGLAKNPVYVKCHADICNLPVVLPHETEMVLIGAAMLGACASKTYATMEKASEAMGGTGTLLKPNTATRDYHNSKYSVFQEMLKDQLKYKSIMQTDLQLNQKFQFYCPDM